VKVSIFKTNKIIYKNNAKSVVLPGDDGEVCLGDFHQAFLCCMKKGFIHIDGKFSFLIRHGIAKMWRNELVILVEQ